MNSFATMAEFFKPQKITPEQLAEVEEWESNRRMALYSDRIKRSGIPVAYLNANLAGCCDAVKEYAEAFTSETKKGMLLTGKFGRGKTYQACAILEHAAHVGTVKFSTMQGILNEITATYSTTESKESVVAAYSNVRLLCIDDLGKEKATDSAAREVYEIIDNRSAGLMPTIITTNYGGKSLLNHFLEYGDAETAGAIMSRIGGMCKPVVIEGDDRRLSWDK